jgi:NitT/TauT family transport system substrate-binding protein
MLVAWMPSEPAAFPERLQKGEIDAFVSIPPYANRLRAEKIGHVIISTTTDQPWSQYFCCLLAAHPQFVQRHPVATKRAYRAILKAAEICAAEPERVARQLVNRGFAPADLGVETRQFPSELPYDKWREYDPEDTIRFYALRMHEIGLIKTGPQKIIAENTDWRFFTQLKRELKA